MEENRGLFKNGSFIYHGVAELEFKYLRIRCNKISNNTHWYTNYDIDI